MGLLLLTSTIASTVVGPFICFFVLLLESSQRCGFMCCVFYLFNPFIHGDKGGSKVSLKGFVIYNIHINLWVSECGAIELKSK